MLYCYVLVLGVALPPELPRPTKAPVLDESQAASLRFPDHAFTQWVLEYNRKHREIVEAKMNLDFASRRTEYWFLLQEIDALYETWQQLDYLQGSVFQYQSSYGEKLRTRIGEKRWAAGQMPPPVPNFPGWSE